MHLINDFSHIFLRLWSVRLAILAGVLSGIEVVLPLFPDALPRGWFAIASFIVTLASIVARAIAQPSLHKKGDGDES